MQALLEIRIDGDEGEDRHVARDYAVYIRFFRVQSGS